MIRITFVVAAIALAASAHTASADLVISKAPTQNMNCSNGVCVPTAKNPVLNVTDLETLLAAGNVEVASYGGKENAGGIQVSAEVSWTESTTLTLSSQKPVYINKAISAAGPGGLVLTSTRESVYIKKTISVAGPGGVVVSASFGQIVFAPKGRIAFSSLASSLTFQGRSYTLVSGLQGMAAAIAANPQGSFALADSYDASADGTYGASPIPTNFLGVLEGLGNTISNISVNNTTACCVGGLFQSISSGGGIMDLRLANVSVISSQGAAGLVYESFGSISTSHVTGTVAGGTTGDIGGMVADNYGGIYRSYATAAVSAASSVTDVNVGGLVGVNISGIQESFATGAVSAGDGAGNIGGLTGQSSNGYSNSNYATGTVSGGAGLNIGGFIGTNDYTGNSTDYGYATGAVSGGTGSTVGGFIGINNNTSITDDYWDTTTSGTNVGVGVGNAASVTGLTTAQLQSGLPPGFQSNWAEKANINNGFPYLIYNPPPK